jgi:hypothetical protein
MGNEKRE